MSTIERRDQAIKTSETCYWVLRPERDVWLTDLSTMTVQIDLISGGFLFVMQGTERNNITDSVI